MRSKLICLKRALKTVMYGNPELQKVFNLSPCKILSFQIFLKIMLVMSFKISFLFLVSADLGLICWLKVETFLNDLTYGKPSSRVVPAYQHLFCKSVVTV